ncbi:MAG TPA: ferric reductase-like transmembrane domain-containing protein [Solirubrobacteraceae bacterium]|jgi:sulfoxide reductase heme-binding subunit YedZ|nr:ferric reductase-like transmembrane domain-containing protein [Solirubrobacteraceae bacterium]
MSTVSLLATAAGPHLFWLASRGAGIAALILASVSVCVGLLMGGRMRGRGTELRVAHEALSLATLAAIAVHGLTLLGDAFMHPSLADVAVPFVSSYQTFWTSAGIVAFWALALLGLSYYFRSRIGVQRWKRLHRLTALAWLLGLIHSLGEGTDAGQTWFLAMTAIVTVPALLLLAVRWARRAAPTPDGAQRARSAAPTPPRPATEQP